MKIEIEKPTIPRFVAYWIESLYYEGGSKYDAIGIMLEHSSKHDKPVRDWFVDNKDEFITAVMYDYGVEQEPLYYAKNKLTGQYLGNKDIGVGTFIPQPVWLFDKYQLKVEKMTKEMFKSVYGLDDTNVYFEEV